FIYLPLNFNAHLLKKQHFLLFLCALFLFNVDFAQADQSLKKDSLIKPAGPDFSKERDIKDVFRSKSKNKRPLFEKDEVSKEKQRHFSFVPAAGYTLQTGFAGILSANLAYYNDNSADAKLSSISTSLTYSQYSQTIIPLLADIWTKGGKYNIISDNRFISYPSSIYGLGGRTDPNKGVTIDFSSIKLHETILKSVAKNFYIGIGIYYDDFWGIRALDPLTRRKDSLLTAELGKGETSVGLTFRLLYDSRLNQINSEDGWYYNLVYRSNQTFLGSDANWGSLLLDVRKYFHFPAHSKNVLAFWNLDWVTTNGTPPYLLLPSTGWDDQYNSGRGYIQGRFRGKDMYYLESEYRYRISRNGLFGGVFFVNIQKFSDDISKQFATDIIGYGLGLRMKLNKHSGANLCVDYGFGKNGSQGFFVNLGEVF
ncbi:MAG: hypothetical protein KGL19_06355, partial [Bacteroidota bacterium]|nr:hypothetical protein [Bacteroidota bacterium]